MALGPGYDAKMGGEIDNNLHIGHAYIMRANYGTTSFKCNWCHVAVPHGWKNKALLASSTDLGPEAGLASCTNTWAGGPDGPTTRPPYYYNFIPLLTSFAPSGSWTVGNCQGLTNMKNLCSSPP